MTAEVVRIARGLSARTVTLSAEVQRWHDALRAQAATGYPKGGARVGGRGSDPPDPTATAVMLNTHGTARGYGPTDEYALVLSQLRVIREALDVMDEYMARRVVPTGPTPRCSGGHLEGAAIPRAEGGWHEAECPNVADHVEYADGSVSLRRSGLCVACAMRLHRWRQRRA